MAKLLKHFGIGSKKASGNTHRSEYNAQKSSSVQELQPKSPPRYRSSVSLSMSNHNDSFDTHSLKSYRASSDGHGQHCCNTAHDHGISHEQCTCRPQHFACRHPTRDQLSPRGSSSTADSSHFGVRGTSVAEESEVFDESPPEASSGGELSSPQNSGSPVQHLSFILCQNLT